MEEQAYANRCDYKSFELQIILKAGFACVSALSPDRGLSPSPLQSIGVANQLVQHVDNLSKLWPVGPLSLPAVQHELVQRHRAVHGRWQPIALINSLDYLNGG